MPNIGYARVSTSDQNADLQVDALKSAGFDLILVEVASGGRDDRPILRQALDRLRPGDVLGVWRLDRLGRSLSHLIDVIGDLGRRKIGFRSLDGNIDTTTSNGMLVFHIFGALGEFERSLIRERTTAGLKAARTRGRIGGNPALKRRDPVAIRKLQAIRRDVFTRQLLAHVDGWLPLVRRLRPQEPWPAVARALNDLPGPPGGRWTEARLIRSVKQLVAGGLAEKSLLDRAPKRVRQARTTAMTRVDEMLLTNPRIPLAEIARRLEASGERTPRNSTSWSMTSVKTLLRTGRRLGHIRLPEPSPPYGPGV